MSEEVDIKDCMSGLEDCLNHLKQMVRKIESVNTSIKLKADVFDIESEVEKMILDIEDLEIDERI